LRWRSSGQVGEVAADLLGVVETYPPADLDDVLGRRVRIADHLRGELSDVRKDVLPGRLVVAGVAIELAEDGGLVGVHRTELGLVRVETVEDDRVEADVGEDAAARVGWRRSELAASVDER